ncbi:hypothetical protein CPC08DRAFT_650213 [Agrocybe pediades]|nr:hypothetical protein CPC08DRAFT_650213 [Agrocybe pediades]
MTESKDDKSSSKQAQIRRVRLRTSKAGRMRPQVPHADKECLASYVEINGLRAWTLWDTGSTTSGITPAFAQVADLTVDTLLDPHILQLGTTGSRWSIKYGVDVDVKLAPDATASKEYLDVANFDRYDMVIGTPLMRKLKACLDFGDNTIRVGKHRIDAVRVVPDADGRIRRQRISSKAD